MVKVFTKKYRACRLNNLKPLQLRLPLFFPSSLSLMLGKVSLFLAPKTDHFSRKLKKKNKKIKQG